ncbi:MAG: molybdenum cofactor biosynthesis protein B [Aminipila sp.]
MGYTAGVITLSDKGFAGQREDISGQAVKDILENQGFEVKYKTILPDDFEKIKEKLIECSDKMKLDLICTTGGTGFSKRDITPEATLAVVERLARGIPEAMRAESMKKTSRAILSRAEAGIRGESIIVNLPGSEKAVKECLGAVIESLKHGIEILKGEASECAGHIHREERAK